MWTGPVGLALTNSRLMRLPGGVVVGAVGRAGGDDLPGDHAEGAPASRMLRKPGPAISTLVDAVGLPQLGRDQLGDLPRGLAGGLGELQRDARRVVAVLLHLGPLDDHLGGNLARSASRCPRRRRQRRARRLELCGSHVPRLQGAIHLLSACAPVHASLHTPSNRWMEPS